MSVLCAIFGHKSLEGVYSGAEYITFQRCGVDGIGREHARLIATCPRCGKKYKAGAIHLPKQKGGAA